MTEKSPSGEKPRRILAYPNVLGMTQLHTRNPYVIALWSSLFPGFGHLLLSKYIRAFILFIWEIVINYQSHVNLAFFFTVLGDFDAAKEAVDIRWSLLYIPTYIFAVWDSYRAAVDMNKQYILASRENAPISPFKMSPFGVAFLNKRSPLVTSSWCALTPGLGHIMIQRIIHGVFILFWWITVIYFSNVLTAIHFTFFGEFAKAREAINPQWFLNIPSLLFYCVYATYVNSVESNKLFDREQSQFLKKNYQSAGFHFPYINDESGAAMYVISTFDQTIHVELAVTAVEEAGISRKDILAVPIERTLLGGRLFDTMRTATGDSVFDLPMILAAFLSLFGCIYGFILSWGPVVWGVIGAFAGFAVGLSVKLLLLRKKKLGGFENEVVILVACLDGKAEQIRQILRDNGALGVTISASDGGESASPRFV
jgi:hypothetical protein